MRGRVNTKMFSHDSHQFSLPLTYSFTFTYCHCFWLKIAKWKEHLFQITLVRLLDDSSAASCQKQLLWLLGWS